MSLLGYAYNRLLKKSRGSAIRDSNIHATSKVESGSTIVRTTFDRHSFCGYDCMIIDCDVGAFCSIAGRVTIGGARHPMEYASTSPVFLSHRDSVKTKFARIPYVWRTKTKIGHDVWIGEAALVKGGVTIGSGAVIGMGSVVTKDVAAYSVVAGNPARHIRYRFPAHVIEALLNFAWWDKSDEELRRLGPLFDRPETLLRQEGLL
jgi:acetyltransferase-like isoleucine patch superfamily enzyme